MLKLVLSAAIFYYPPMLKQPYTPNVLARQELVALLNRSALFKGLSQSTLNHFAEKASVSHAPKGKVIFLQGDESQCFYLILQGWVKLFRETMEGTEAVIDVLNRNCVFGETSTLSDQRQNYGAEAVEESHFLAMPTSLLRHYLERDQQMAMNMLACMAQHQREQDLEIEHLNMQTAPQRIGCFLLRLCPGSSPGAVELHLPYDKTLIAARLGMKPETFSRALAKLKQDIGLQIHGATLTIQSVDMLEDYTCMHCSNSFPCGEHTPLSS